MSGHSNTTPFPRGPLLGAAALVVATLLGVAGFRLTANPADAHAAQPASIDSRDLRFLDRADGAVIVLEGPLDKEVAVIAPGTNGFLRGVLRGLARERRSMDMGDRIAFRIGRSRDGRIAIDDLATGRHVDLGAFGPTNTQAFSRLLDRDSPVAPPGPREPVLLQARATTR